MSRFINVDGAVSLNGEQARTFLAFDEALRRFAVASKAEDEALALRDAAQAALETACDAMRLARRKLHEAREAYEEALT